MSKKHTLNELNNMSREDLITIVLTIQGQLDTLNDNIEKLMEQVRLANQHRFGHSTETLKSIDVYGLHNLWNIPVAVYYYCFLRTYTDPIRV